MLKFTVFVFVVLNKNIYIIFLRDVLHKCKQKSLNPFVLSIQFNGFAFAICFHEFIIYFYMFVFYIIFIFIFFFFGDCSIIYGYVLFFSSCFYFVYTLAFSVFGSIFFVVVVKIV